MAFEPYRYELVSLSSDGFTLHEVIAYAAEPVEMDGELHRVVIYTDYSAEIESELDFQESLAETMRRIEAARLPE